MRKYIKKIIFILLVIIIAWFGIQIIIEVNFYIKNGTSDSTESSEQIGTISIYASDISYPTLDSLTGHSWIYIENNSDESFYINNIEVKPNEGISMGTSAVPTLEHRGIWFNLEGHVKSYLENHSMTKNFYIEDLEYLENYLYYHDRWTVLYNCATFSTGIWNNINTNDGRILHALSPKGLENEMEEYEDFEINKEFNPMDYVVPYDK